MPELFRFGLLALVAVYLAVVVHEVGHALTGRAMGLVVTSLGLGTARPVLIPPIGRTRLYFGLIQPFQGITFAFLPRHYSGWRRLATFIAGGIAANAGSAAASFCLARNLPNGNPATFFEVFAAVNALIGALSLLPVRINVGHGMLRSDGRMLLDAIRSGTMTPLPPDVIQTAQGCRPLWESIGDGRMNRLYTLCAASSWLDLGCTVKAEVLFAEAAAIDAPHPHIDWLEAFIRANLALAKGEVAEARAALVHVERLTDPAASEGRYLLALLQADLSRIEGDPGRALAAFERLALDPVAARCPDLGLATLTSQLRAACIVGDREAIVELCNRFESRRPSPSEVHNLHFYGTLVRFAWSQGDGHRRTLQALAALAALWRDPAEKAAFIEAQRALIDGARRELGAGSTPFFEAIETQQADVPSMDRDKALRRWALLLTVINVVSIAPCFLLALAMGRPQGGPAVFLAGMLALFTLPGACCLLFELAVGRFLPTLHRLTGFVLLALAVTPWVGGVIFGFAQWNP